jgi:hypothetical protein
MPSPNIICRPLPADFAFPIFDSNSTMSL